VKEYQQFYSRFDTIAYRSVTYLYRRTNWTDDKR